MLEVLQIPARKDNYIYLLHESVDGQTAVVDPADAEPVLALLQEKSWRLDVIFNTHHHDDHIAGNRLLKQQTGCKIVAAKADQHRIPDIDIAVTADDQICLGGLNWQVLATPGHTLGHIVYYNAEHNSLFCGDTLFAMGCGRLFEGSAEQMWHSLQQLKALPAETLIYPAHEYTLANARFAVTLEPDNAALQNRLQEVIALRNQHLPTLPTTLSLELATNPFLREHSVELRNNIGFTSDVDDVKVFTRIRQLKDQW